MSSVDEMYSNKIKINGACYYSGINRITYGYNRIWALLRNYGIRIARKTVYKK